MLKMVSQFKNEFLKQCIICQRIILIISENSSKEHYVIVKIKEIKKVSNKQLELQLKFVFAKENITVPDTLFSTFQANDIFLYPLKTPEN